MKLRRIGCISLLLVMLIAASVGCLNSKQTVEEIKVKAVNLNEVNDGNYRGSYRGNKFVKVVVEVKVKDHVIEEIKLVKHDNGLGGKAEVIPDKVIKAQSLKVDVVSGATVSSKTILKAIETALKKGIEGTE